MALLTLIARGSDGLPLSASIVDDEVRTFFLLSELFCLKCYYWCSQSGRNFAEYQNRAKQIFRKLSNNSPNKCTIECDGLVFQSVTKQFCTTTHHCFLPLSLLPSLIPSPPPSATSLRQAYATWCCVSPPFLPDWPSPTWKTCIRSLESNTDRRYTKQRDHTTS